MINTKTSPQSIGEILEKTKGIGQGFDALRIALSLLVMLTHSVPLSTGIASFDIRENWLRYGIFAILPMFFGLSGFLVTGSAIRVKSGFKFFLQRAFRLIPALTVEVFLSAIILGGLLTTLPAQEYFTNHQFWAYFGNIIGDVHFELPGVFKDNPFPGSVNGNMWTLRPEYYCYAILLGSMFVGFFKSERLYISSITVIILYYIFIDITKNAGKPEYSYSSDGLVFCFLVGSLYFRISKILPYSKILFAISIAGWILLLNIDGGSYLALLCIVYATIFIGCTKITLPRIFRTGDYSYGVYLYGFPIQQTLVYAFTFTHKWYILFATSAPLTLIVAMISWHAIEKPALKIRSKLPF